MKGRKPKPGAIKELHGTDRKDRQRGDEPKPAAALPEAPTHLSVVARAEWDRIAPELLALGLLSKLDRAALAAYCTAWGRWVEAENIVREHGPIINNNGQAALSPYLAVADRAMKQLREFLVEFGLSPSSRTRVAPTKSPGKPPIGKRDRTREPFANDAAKPSKRRA
jgi:P27 family predicted phage terminase small subunit